MPTPRPPVGGSEEVQARGSAHPSIPDGWHLSSINFQTKGVAMTEKSVLFDTGYIVRTPGALLALIEAQVSESSLIERHLGGDFGDVGAEDDAHNHRAIAEGERITSCYGIDGETKVWVITEADRSVTTVLLPSEY